MAERVMIGLLLAKIESSYGTDPVPVGGSNVIAVSRNTVSFGPKFTHVERAYMDGTLDKVSGFNVLPEVDLSFDVEVRGNRTDGSTIDISKGASAQAIEIDCLLKSCDLSPTYTAESGSGNRDGYVTYIPNVPTDAGSSVTFYFYTEKKLHKITGAKGSVKVTMTAGKVPVLSFSFKGLYQPPVDTSGAMSAAGSCLATATVASGGAAYVVGDVLTIAGGTGTAATVRVTAVAPTTGAVTAVRVLNVGLYSVAPSTPNSATGGTGTTVSLTITSWAQTAAVWLATKPSIFVSAGSTVDSFSPVFQKLDFDLGATVSKREDANSANNVAGFMITDRAPKASIDPESVAEATSPIWYDLEQATNRTITATVGTLTGNKFTLTVKGTSDSVGYGDRSNVRTQPIGYMVEKAALGDTAGAHVALKFF